MPPASISSTTQALRLPELLYAIFGFLDKSSHAQNVRVCKEWHEVALDFIWRDVSGLHRILNCLSPLVLDDDKSWVFSIPPTQNSWNLFDKYRRRVFSLKHIGPVIRINPMIKFSDQVFNDIITTRPINSEIFPNLKSLELDKDFFKCTVFMHNEITNFKLHIRHKEETASWYSEFFPEIGRRMPNLTEIDIQIDKPAPMDTVEFVTIELVKALPKLKRVILPPPFTPEMADYCVQSDALRSFSCRKFRDASPHPMFRDPDSFQSPTNYVSHSISSLFITLPFCDAVKFIRRLTAPEKIKEFGIASILPETRKSFATLITTVAEIFTGLRTLGLYSPPSFRNGTKGRINRRVLAPLLHLSGLHHLDIVHGEPLDLHYQDLEDMALAWPSIKTLNLNPTPASYSPPSLTLEALQPFSRHSHDLFHLGLYLDTTNASMDSLHDCPQFQSLGALAVAMSTVQETSLIAMIFSRIFPADCRLAHFRPVDVRCMPKEYGNVFLSRSKQWGEVARLLPFFVRARLEERKVIN